MEPSGTAFKNRSMLEDERASEVEKSRKRYGWSENRFATVGHVYSVMVEELRIENPDIHAFIHELNELMSKRGFGYLRVGKPTDDLAGYRQLGLKSFLVNKLGEGVLDEESASKIMLEAVGGFDYDDSAKFLGRFWKSR